MTNMTAITGFMKTDTSYSLRGEELYVSVSTCAAVVQQNTLEF